LPITTRFWWSAAAKQAAGRPAEAQGHLGGHRIGIAAPTDPVGAEQPPLHVEILLLANDDAP
jgi:hypothetical protein